MAKSEKQLEAEEKATAEKKAAEEKTATKEEKPAPERIAYVKACEKYQEALRNKDATPEEKRNLLKVKHRAYDVCKSAGA